MSKYIGKHWGNLFLREDEDISELTEVSGLLEIKLSAPVRAPLLTTLGYLDIAWHSSLDAPKLRLLGGVQIVPPEVARRNLLAVAEVATMTDALNMKTWHTCNTVHCIAGWAVHLAGDEGYELVRIMGNTQDAAMILLGPSAQRLFYLKQDHALAELHKILSDAEELI